MIGEVYGGVSLPFEAIGQAGILLNGCCASHLYQTPEHDALLARGGEGPALPA